MIVNVIFTSAISLLGSGQVLRPLPEDFPQAAWAKRAEGQVKLRINGEIDGTIQCSVTSRTSSTALNDASCPLVVARLKALGWHDTKPVSVRVGWRVPYSGVTLDYGGAIPFDPSLWVLPNDVPTGKIVKYADGKTSVTFAIGSDGSVSDCQIVAASGSDQLDQKLCRLIIDRAAFLPSLAADGTARITRGRTAITWWVSL